MDWINYLNEILERGEKKSAICIEIGLARPSLDDLLNGYTKSVKYEVGAKILALHKKVMRRKSA